MYCISINHKTADIEVRKRLAFSENEQIGFIRAVLGGTDDNARQCVLLCTCNRTEVYFDGDENTAEQAMKLLAEHGGFETDGLAPYVMRFADGGAISHLFRTAAGLDSMVIGEDEILRQLKSSYALAKENGAADGDFNMIFQSAFACAKKIKTQTSLSKIPISVASLAAKEAIFFSDDVINVLVIGASGKTGMTVLRNLAAHRNVRLFATLRRRNASGGIGDFQSQQINALWKLGQDFRPENGIRFTDYADRYDMLDRADCVISATSGPHYTITARDAKAHIKTAKPRLFIDLAVPPDIDGAVAKLDGARLTGIDYFERLAAENNARKADSAQTAAEIIDKETDELKKELAFRKFVPHMDGLKGLDATNIIYKLKSALNYEQLTAVLNAISPHGEQREDNE